MNPPKYTAIQDINFLIGTQKAYSCSEAERVQPVSENAPSDDAITRLLHRLEPSTEELWLEAKAFVKQDSGILVIDDTMLELVLCSGYGFGQSAMVWQAQASRERDQLNKFVVVGWG